MTLDLSAVENLKAARSDIRVNWRTRGMPLGLLFFRHAAGLSVIISDRFHLCGARVETCLVEVSARHDVTGGLNRHVLDDAARQQPLGNADVHRGCRDYLTSVGAGA